MSTPTRDATSSSSPTAARQATVERPVLKVLIVSLILAGIAAAVLSLLFSF